MLKASLGTDWSECEHAYNTGDVHTVFIFIIKSLKWVSSLCFIPFIIFVENGR